jgi:hypothetical protein
MSDNRGITKVYPKKVITVYTACYGLDMKYPPKGSWVEDW